MNIPCANCHTKIDPTYSDVEAWGHDFNCCSVACGRTLSGKLRKSEYYKHVQGLISAQKILTDRIERMKQSIQYNSIQWQQKGNDDG